MSSSPADRERILEMFNQMNSSSSPSQEDSLNHPPTFRCYGLSCRYITGFPANFPRSKTHPCRNGCGRIYCSAACEQSQWDYGHQFACKHIVEARAKAVAAGLTDKDGNPDYKNVKQYTKIISKDETISQMAAAADAVEKNLALPAVLNRTPKGAPPDFQSRRFRVGQRVLCHGVAGERWRPGTVLSLFYIQGSQYGPPQILPYEIELDDGLFCSAPADSDCAIRRLPGSPILRDAFPIPGTLIRQVKEEIYEKNNSMSRMHAARFRLSCESRCDRHRCSGCGKSSKEELRACTRCVVNTYCNSKCQKADYPKHREFCKTMAKCKDLAMKELKDLQRNREKIDESRTTDEERFAALEKHFAKQTKYSRQLVALVRDVVKLSKEEDDPYKAMTEYIQKKSDDFFRTHDSHDDVYPPEGDPLLTLDNLHRLIGGVIYFWSTSPDLSEYCACAAAYIFETSHITTLRAAVDLEKLTLHV